MRIPTPFAISPSSTAGPDEDAQPGAYQEPPEKEEDHEPDQQDEKSVGRIVKTEEVRRAGEDRKFLQQDRRSSPYPYGRVLKNKDKTEGQQHLGQGLDPEPAKENAFRQYSQNGHGEHGEEDGKGKISGQANR